MNSYMPHPQVEDAKSKCVTQICRLFFRDGQIASGQIQAGSRYQEAPVLYSGAIERLPVRYETADSVLLRVMFRSFARELRARFEEELIGTWEPFIEEEQDGEDLPPESVSSHPDN